MIIVRANYAILLLAYLCFLATSNHTVSHGPAMCILEALPAVVIALQVIRPTRAVWAIIAVPMAMYSAVVMLFIGDRIVRSEAVRGEHFEIMAACIYIGWCLLAHHALMARREPHDQATPARR